MPLGPVELLVLEFPGNQFKGEIVPALKELVESGTIRVIDILFMTKDPQGKVATVEINDLDDTIYAAFDPVISDITGLLTEDDMRQFASMLDNNSSAAVMLFENTWATRFADAVANAHGQVMLNERVPRAVVNELLQQSAQLQPAMS